MDPKLTPRFIACYMGLGVVLIASALGAWAAYKIPSVQHKVAHVEAQLGDQNLTRLTDVFINLQAKAHNLSVVKIIIIRQDVKGDTARVTARATFTDGYSTITQEIICVLRKGVWQPEQLLPA